MHFLIDISCKASVCTKGRYWRLHAQKPLHDVRVSWRTLSCSNDHLEMVPISAIKGRIHIHCTTSSVEVISDNYCYLSECLHRLLGVVMGAVIEAWWCRGLDASILTILSSSRLCPITALLKFFSGHTLNPVFTHLGPFRNEPTGFYTFNLQHPSTDRQILSRFYWQNPDKTHSVVSVSNTTLVGILSGISVGRLNQPLIRSHPIILGSWQTRTFS